MFHRARSCIIQQPFTPVSHTPPHTLPLPHSWTTSGLKSQGRLSVGSNRDREISMSVGLGRSKLDSKGGVVGGNIDVNTLEMVCKYAGFCFSRDSLATTRREPATPPRVLTHEAFVLQPTSPNTPINNRATRSKSPWAPQRPAWTTWAPAS